MTEFIPVPVITEVIEEDNSVSKIGSAVRLFEDARIFSDIIRRSAKFKNIDIPDSVLLLSGEVFYGAGEIEEVRCIGYDASRLDDDGNILLESIYKTDLTPSLGKVERDGQVFARPENYQREHLVFYALPAESFNLPENMVLFSWKLPADAEKFNKQIYRETRLYLAFHNSCSLLSEAASLLTSEEGLNFLEKNLGKLSLGEIKNLLLPLPPPPDAPLSRIEFQGRNESLLYTYNLSALAYEFGLNYHGSLVLNDRIIERKAQENGWSIQRAKAVVCVQYAAGMREYVDYAVEKHVEFCKPALHLVAEKLLGAGLWTYILYNLKSANIHLRGEKPQLRTSYFDKFFDGVRRLIPAPMGPPKGRVKENVYDEEKTRKIMTAIENICRQRIAARHPKPDSITQSAVAHQLNLDNRTLYNWLTKNDIEYSILHDEIVRKIMK